TVTSASLLCAPTLDVPLPSLRGDAFPFGGFLLPGTISGTTLLHPVRLVAARPVLHAWHEQHNRPPYCWKCSKPGRLPGVTSQLRISVSVFLVSCARTISPGSYLPPRCDSQAG